MEKLLKIKGLKKYFHYRKGWGHKGSVKAVDGIELSVYKGETFAIVGESGCGKSTTGRCILRLIEPTEGNVFFEERNLLSITKREMREMRKHLQIIFQDPYESLNPRATIKQILQEPLIAHRVPVRHRKRTIEQMIETVGLSPDQLHLYPHQFSGGQKQRIGIARALVLNPKLIVADEPVSALDVSIQSQVLNLMMDLQEEFNLTYIFISHDLSVVEYIADRVAVMYLGKVVELGRKDALFRKPLHPYTQALISAVPSPDPFARKERIILQGDIPSPANPPAGCRFHTRCPACMNVCKVEEPKLKQLENGNFVACHLY